MKKGIIWGYSREWMEEETRCRSEDGERKKREKK
jgi:hypothetical protein